MGTLLLLLTAFIWGCAFVAQSDGMKHVGPLTFMSSRFLLGGAVFTPVIFFRKITVTGKTKPFHIELKEGLVGGILFLPLMVRLNMELIKKNYL